VTTITVGNGEKYSTIAAAVAASSSGDTINVAAGTYTNDVLNISHSLTLQAVGGMVNLVGTAQPANGKGIIDEGGPGVNVTISGFDISGATVKDANGAGVRYEGGNLTLNNVNIHNNQNGILANADANGSITIANSSFANNGIGDGKTHNIYVGAVGSLTVKDSTITSAQVGHDIKSRAASTTITGNTITDGSTGTASYEIDLTNGGIGDIENNYIVKGANAQNPIAITFGEEGNVYANSSLTVKGNTIVNDYTTHYTTAVVNRTGATANISGNQLYGWNSVASGPANIGSNTTATTKPAQASQPTSSATQSGPTPTSAVVSSPTPDAVSGTTAMNAPMPAVTNGTAMAGSNVGSTMDTASGNTTISPDTVAASPATPSFVADGSASGLQQSPADSSGSLSASDVTSQTLADHADAAAMSAEPVVVSTDWTMSPDQTGRTDAGQYCSGQDQSGGTGVSAMIRSDQNQSASGTTVYASMHSA